MGENKYKSVVNGQLVSPHQYIAELSVKKKAEKEKVVLPHGYWNDKDSEWAKEYKKQVIAASKLLKKYSPEAIIKTLNGNQWKYSLCTKDFAQRTASNQKTIDSRVFTKPKIIISETQSQDNKPFQKKSKKWD